MAFIQSAQLCKGLPEAALGHLYSAGVVWERPLGTEIIVEGASASHGLFFVLEGSLKVAKLRGEVPMELATLERPAVFGEIGLLTEQPSSATVVAASDVQLIHVPAIAVRALAEAEPKLGKRLALLMAARVKDTEKKLG